MWKVFVVHTLFGVFCVAVAAAQVADLALQCPPKGFLSGKPTPLECTVQGNRLTTAPCLAPIDTIKLEVVDSSGPTLAGRSVFPACEPNSSHSENVGGRCIDKDNNNVYRYEFTVTVFDNTLTSDTRYRCFAECAVLPGQTFDLSVNTSETCGPPVKFQESTTTVRPANTTASEDNKDDGDGDTAATAGGTVGGVAVCAAVLGVGAFLLSKTKLTVCVGFPREQIKRIDYYAKKLEENLHILSDKLKPFHATVTIENQRTSDGSKSKGGTEHLHILVKRSHRAGLKKWKEILNKVEEFLKEYVRQPFVRTIFVLENTKIPDESSIKIEGVTIIFPTENETVKNERIGAENNEAAEKKVVRIFHTAKNEEGKDVIQIEGPSQKSVEAVEKKVKDELMKQHTVTRIVPQKPETKLDDVSRQYIEEMTGTTIHKEENLTPKQIKIEGFNDRYVQEAETKVKEFLKNNVRMVLVPDGGYPIDSEELKKIRKQTGVNVSGPFENGKDQYVVQVDGQDPGVEEAVRKVKALWP